MTGGEGRPYLASKAMPEAPDTDREGADVMGRRSRLASEDLIAPLRTTSIARVERCSSESVNRIDANVRCRMFAWV